MFKIGVIADTHGHLDPRVPGLFTAAEVQHILHAGDIGLPWLILQLEEIAPVTAVTGNTDAGLHLSYRETELVELAGLRFLLHHIVDVHSPAPALQRRLIRDNPEAVILGIATGPFRSKSTGGFSLIPATQANPGLGWPAAWPF